MNTASVLFLLNVLLIFSSCQEKIDDVDRGISIGKLHISKTYPKPGDSIKIQYQPEDKSSNQVIYGFFDCIVDNRFYPMDINLSEINGEWEGQLIIPDSATAINFYFKNEDTYTRNTKYVKELYEDNDKILIGSMASKGYYQSKIAQWYDLKVNKDSSLLFIQNDILRNSDLMEKWDVDYAGLLLSQDIQKGEELISKRIHNYQNKEDINGEDYEKMLRLYHLVGNNKSADSIAEVATKAFPKSKTARSHMISKIYKEVDFQKKEKLIEEFDSKFQNTTLEKDRIFSSIANSFIRKNNVEGFSKITDKISNSDRKAGLFNQIAWKLVEKGERLEYAEKISKSSLEIIKSLQSEPGEIPSYLSDNQYQHELKGKYLTYVDTYALIRFKQGEFSDALKYQIEALGNKKVGIPEVNERFIQFLLVNEKTQEAQNEASRFITLNKSTAKLKEYFKKAYVINQGSETGFQDYLRALEEQENERALAELKNKLIDEEAYDFNLKNLIGEEVKLSTLKGKTVILDFWATWCGPCKDSFPGMQLAVDKYKDDPNVVFLFIDTFEGDPFEKRQHKVKDFITQNKYTFNVLFDLPVKEGSRQYVTANEYGIKGIPTKIILGPDGNVKFKAIGYEGSPEELAAELKIIIDLINSKPAYNFEQKT